MERRNDALHRVVKEDRTDADGLCANSNACGTEERLVLTHGFPLVVEDGPAAADPAWIDVWAARDKRAGLGLDLLLDLAPEAVGIRERVLDFRLLTRLEIGGMCLARSV